MVILTGTTMNHIPNLLSLDLHDFWAQKATPMYIRGNADTEIDLSTSGYSMATALASNAAQTTLTVRANCNCQCMLLTVEAFALLEVRGHMQVQG